MIQRPKAHEVERYANVIVEDDEKVADRFTHVQAPIVGTTKEPDADEDVTKPSSSVGVQEPTRSWANRPTTSKLNYLHHAVPCANPPLALITASDTVKMAVLIVASDRHVTTFLWPEEPDELVDFELLVCDLRSIQQHQWAALVAFSRRHDRPPLLILDDEVHASRRQLAKISCEEWLPLDCNGRDLALAVAKQSHHHRLRNVQAALLQQLMPPQALACLINELFTGTRLWCRLGSVARKLSLPESTLRRQWNIAAGPDLKLNGFLKPILLT